MPATPETTTAFHELLDALKGIDASFFQDGDRALRDEQSVLEGYKWIFSILQVANDVYLWGDSARPRFVDIVGPYKKWGGDNADAYYQFFPVDPDRTYRISGRAGDAVYFSLTVYGGPNDGRYTERLVGTVNNRLLDIAEDGSFELYVGPARPEGYDGPFIDTSDGDAVHAITRDYLNDPVDGRRVEWTVEPLEPAGQFHLTDAAVAKRLRAVTTWVRTQAHMVPLELGVPNSVAEPFLVEQVTYGWAAGDAAYAMGSFDLDDDEALVIRGAWPDNAFWNVCLWNQFMHTYNYDYERVTLNGGQAAADPDGSYTLVIAHHDPGHPNWLSTQGHPAGRIWFRWFHPDRCPDPLDVAVVGLDDVVDTTSG